MIILRKIIRFIAFISAILFPYIFCKYIDYFINLVLSYRLCYFSGCKNSKVYLERPFFIHGHKYLKFSNFRSRAGLRLECIDEYEGYKYSPSIIIGNNVSFNFRCHVGAINKIIIGNNVLIGSNVLITDHSHGEFNEHDLLVIPDKRKLYSKGEVIINDNVWIGENVSILPNVIIGKNSIIAANSVVTKNVPENCIFAGNPARLIKHIDSIN